MKGYNPINIKFETANTHKKPMPLELGMIPCTKDIEECKCKKCKTQK